MKYRCAWLDNSKKDYIKYHDEDWGVQEHNDRKLFAKLILDGAQAGLSWYTILKKRDNYQKAFDDWDYEKIAKYDTSKEQELLQNAGIIRNKLKIKSAIKNAQVFIKIRKEFGSFDKYLWSYVDHKQILNKFEKMEEIPASTDLSLKISKDLKKRGMNFVGPTIIYAFMQAIGMVNDHEINCFRYNEVQ